MVDTISISPVSVSEIILLYPAPAPIRVPIGFDSVTHAPVSVVTLQSTIIHTIIPITRNEYPESGLHCKYYVNLCVGVFLTKCLREKRGMDILN
jgi:hypothetical protein